MNQAMANNANDEGAWIPGTPLPAVLRPRLTRVDIARFAAAVGDFNPIHCDEEFARAAGFRSVIAHGPLTLSMFARILGGAFGPENVRSIQVQFRAPALPGDDLRIEGSVTEIVKQDGERRARCKLRVANQSDTTVALGTGEAVVRGD